VNNKFQLILIVIHTVVSYIKPLVTFSSWEEQKFLAIKYISLSILINRIVINIISKGRRLCYVLFRKSKCPRTLYFPACTLHSSRVCL